MQPKDIRTQRDLVLYRLETAKEDLKSAKILRDANSYKGANNRAYYAVFHAINAIHGLRGVAYKRHKDAIANFNKEYVKTEIFPREIGRKISGVEEIRLQGVWKQYAKCWEVGYPVKRSFLWITPKQNCKPLSRNYSRKCKMD